MSGIQFRPSNRPGLCLGRPAEIDVQLCEIDMPGVRGPQINGKLSAVDAEYSSSTSGRLSNSEEVQKDGLRESIYSNAVRNIVFLGRKKGQQPVRFNSYIAGPAEYTVHRPVEAPVRHLNADRKGLKAHDGHSVAC